MSRPAIEPTRTEATRPRGGPSEPWERDLAARRRVRDLLHGVPAGFVVFDALELPRPTRVVVDHLVIGPRNAWAVTTHVLAEPVSYGRGRNDDTLWSGSTPLRTVLEAADWESTALSEHIGFPVEPVICIVAPGLPAPAFDFHGIRISDPLSLVRQVVTSTADFLDVEAATDAVRRTFGVEPSSGTAPPKLGTAVQPPMMRASRTARRRRTMGARVHALKSSRAVRVGVSFALAATFVASLPTIISVWNSVASEGAEQITAVFDDEAIADTTPSPAAASDPATVGFELTCPAPGAGWMIEWSWPGPLGPDVVGYTVTTRTRGASAVVHTATTWSDPSSPPPAARLANPAGTQVITDHRAADGSIVTSAREIVGAPGGTC